MFETAKINHFLLVPKSIVFIKKVFFFVFLVTKLQTLFFFLQKILLYNLNVENICIK